MGRDRIMADVKQALMRVESFDEHESLSGYTGFSKDSAIKGVQREHSVSETTDGF